MILLLGLACTPAKLLHMREDQDRKNLAEGADLYWKAAHWCDAGGLAALLPRPEDQLAVARVCASPALKVTDARILQVVVGPELVEPRHRHVADLTEKWRTGTVLVQVESYGVSSTKLVTTTEEQAWLLDARGWHVDTTLSPIDGDRPW